MASADRIVVRPCGLMEQYSTARHSLGIYFGVSVTARYAVPSRHDSVDALRAVIEKAVAQVVLGQPFMRIGIAGEETKDPLYVHVPQIDLSSNHIRWLEPLELVNSTSADAQLAEQACAQLSGPWPDVESRPPWRVTVLPLRESAQSGTGRIAALDIMYAFHHAIGDGTSGSIFLTQLLRALARPADHQDLSSLSPSGILSLDKPAVLPAPQESLITFPLSWSYFLQAVWKAFGPAALKPAPPSPLPWTGRQPANQSKPFQMNARVVEIPASTVKKLLALTRGRGTTLTPLFHALVLASMAKRLSAEDAPNFVHGSSISLRGLVGPEVLDTKTQMSVLVSSVTHPLEAELVARFRADQGSDPDVDAALWEVAARIKKQFDEKRTTLPKDDVAGLMRYVTDRHAYLKRADGKPFDWTWEVSNLGSIKGRAGSTEEEEEGYAANADGGWEIVRAVFAQSAMLSGPAMTLDVVGVADGPVTATLVWQEDVMDRELMDQVAADLESYARNLGDKGSLKL